MGLQLDKKLQTLIKGLKTVDKAVSDAVAKQATAAPWSNFSDQSFGDQKTAKKEERELKKTFDRTGANEQYVAARGKRESTSAETAQAKVAGDFLAACERDKRMQWRPRIRQVAHAMARRAGNGSDTGPLAKNVIDFVQRFFLKAQEKQPNGG